MESGTREESVKWGALMKCGLGRQQHIEESDGVKTQENDDNR